MIDVQSIKTESRNVKTLDIDEKSTYEMMSIINEEDAIVPLAVSRALPAVVLAAEKITEAFQKGGRLIYTGAGTSGKLGLLDASECPPTYGVDPSQVIALLAGGDEALKTTREDAEDNAEAGRSDILSVKVTENDVVVGIAASGRTPYTLGAIEAANSQGAFTIALVCSSGSLMAAEASHAIELILGPEIITGSTRMKAGTAQKLVLNMLSTVSMIKIGKVYSNLMVDVQPTNLKLQERALSIVMEASGADRNEAATAMQEQKNNTKAAIVQLITGEGGEYPEQLLGKHNGHLREAIKNHLHFTEESN
ncbi:N-acetylmuramic acid 6-phosphate etherase [Sinobaca qinghaiensis]|uniref:N-acetylmuramic acid 6-phosphate etherase n=1 Tax=Sinobaca qinghaiensis TaxID=342944 RepID=A0A419V7N5_9BACL|nr:N-acetylmuramic acid 6-phosphate etherase [Sinobaca qinghaiensis]